MVKEISDAEFNSEIIESKTPAAVDFWAPWCGPCRMLGPVLEKISQSKEYSGKIKFFKINIEENSDNAQEYNVQSIPCTIIFNKGKEAGRITGFGGEGSLKEKLNKILSNLN